MVDLSNGIHIVHSLVKQSLTENTEPFLTSSRLVEDLRQIKQCLAMGIAGLSTDDLTALFPVALFLQGYEVVGEDTLVGHHFWGIQFLDPGGIRHAGMGTVVEYVNDLRVYQELMSQYNYVSGVFYLAEKESLPRDSVSDRVKVMDRDDLANVLMALAMTKYMDTFLHTIQSNPVFKEKIQVTIDDAGLCWETITAIFKRWATIAED